MSAVLFWKKRIYLIVSGVLSTLIVCFVLIYAYSFVGVQTIALNKNFYFLISSSTHIEASTNYVDKNGGAGYLLEVNNREYVTYSVYLTETESQAVYAKVSALEEGIEIMTMHVGDVYLKTKAQKDKKEQIEGAFRSLYGCIEVLNSEIDRLAKGATQQSSKRVLEVLKKQLDFLSAKYEKVLPSFHELCKRTSNELFSFIKDMVYVKDLRYVQCELCHSYAKLAKGYAL